MLVRLGVHERRTNLLKRAYFEALRRDLIARIRRACGDWPDAALLELAAKMTRLRLKYESRTGLPGFN